MDLSVSGIKVMTHSFLTLYSELEIKGRQHLKEIGKIYWYFRCSLVFQEMNNNQFFKAFLL